VKTIILLLVVLFTGACANAQGVQATSPKTQAVGKSAPQSKTKPETPHLEFVTEYIRELAATQEIRDSAESDLTQDPQAVFSNCIHSSTLMQLELGSQVSQLKRMRLDDPYIDLIPNIIQFYQDKIELWRQMVDICSAFVAGPKPNVDYGKLGADMPKVRAKLDFIDKALFEATPAIFMTLIDSKPDSKGNASHLVITKAEREDLIEKIDTDFGPKLDDKNANFTISSAWVLKKGLQKDFKSSDDPWD
jgi:hypothetical protein